MGISGLRSYPGEVVPWEVGGGVSLGHGTGGWVPFSLLLTPCGGHHTHGQQAGGTHPVRMLSYFFTHFIGLGLGVGQCK